MIELRAGSKPARNHPAQLTASNMPISAVHPNSKPWGRLWLALTIRSSGVGAPRSRRAGSTATRFAPATPLRQSQRPALAVRNAARSHTLGRLRLGSALPDHARALRTLRHGARPAA